jgi:hypothetical protein
MKLKNIKNKEIKTGILIFSILILTLSFFFIYKRISQVRASDRNWMQTSWVGGQTDDVISTDVTTYKELSNVVAGENLEVAPLSDWPVEYSNWDKRQEITITNNGDELTDYYIKATVVYDDSMNNDFSDLRFTDASGSILSYWIPSQTDGVEANVWVKVPTLSANTDTDIYMYKGNRAATTTSSLDYGTEATPALGCNELYRKFQNGPSGVYFIDPDDDGTNIKEVYCDMNEETSSGWLLVHNYEHLGGTNPTIAPSEEFPVMPYGNLTISGIVSRGDNGELTHVDNISQYGFGNIDAVRLYGATTSHSRIIHYYTTNLNVISSVVNTSIAGNSDLRSNVTHLSDHTAFLPDAASAQTQIDTNHIFGYKFPMYRAGQYHWATAGSGTRWEVDDYAGGYTQTTIHRIWVRDETTEPDITWDITQSMGEDEYNFETTAYLTSNIYDTGYASDWAALTYSTSLSDAVDVKIRTSNSEIMSGVLDWESCNAVISGEDISSNNCVNDEDRYIQYRVEIDMTGQSESPVFDSITITFAASDQTPPETNATGVQLDGLLGEGDWFNYEPTITWTPGSDDPQGKGLEGYCIGLEEVDIGADPLGLDPSLENGSGMLSTFDDGVINSACEYIVTDTSLDLSNIDGLELSPNKEYYFSIKAVDLAGNIWEGIQANYQNLTWFKYDDTPPANVMYISTPSTDFGSINDMFFNWPITGSSQAVDNESDILGWQYAVNSSSPASWKGTETHPELEIDYIPASGITEGILYLSTTRDGDLPIGNNTIYFRALDNAGNVSTYVTGGINYGGAAPEFPAESVVTITPGTSISNQFSLSWPEAVPGDGDEIESYYYMINTEPPSSLSTLENNNHVYIPTDNLSVATGKLVGAVKGVNNVYVVAVDNQDNYSPTKAIHGTFTLNSTVPDAPQAVSAADLSIKGSELWRVALTWEEPAYKGNGDLTYIIERSGDGVTWTEVSRTAGLSYTDIVPESKTYYYKVASIDTSNESILNPTYSTLVELQPKGRYEEPPELISDPVTTEVTTRYGKVTWATDRVSDSKVQIGVSSGEYFQDEMYRSDMVTNHEIELTNLTPGTQYYYRVKWTDEDGNTGVSKESVFQTKPAPVVEDIVIDSVGLNYAIIKLTTSGATRARVIYGLTKNYGGSQDINTSTESSEYSIMLRDLEDGTDYHYKIVLTDEEGFEYESFEDHVFSTPPRPQVSNVQIQEKKGVPTPTIEVFWESNIPVNSIVKYSNEGQTLDKVDMELVEGEHSMEIEGLDPDSAYQLTVEGVDAMGNRATSDVYAFTTATDTRPPEVFGIRSEGDIQSSDIQTDRSRSAQLIISWETDEPSTSQVLYGEGAANDGYPYSTQTDAEMRYKHVMIVSNLTPSKVYHFKVVSKDSAGNVGESGSVTSITPKSTDTVVESVLGSLGRIFDFF